jgi:hypothetical protein
MCAKALQYLADNPTRQTTVTHIDALVRHRLLIDLTWHNAFPVPARCSEVVTRGTTDPRA